MAPVGVPAADPAPDAGRDLALGIPALRAAGQTDAERDERGREHEDSDDDEQG